MNRNIFIGFIFMFTSGCVLTKNQSELNPLIFSYSAPIEDVRKTVNEQFSDKKYKTLPLQQGYSESEREYFKLSEVENRNHFFLNKSGEFSTGKSEYYRSVFGKRLELYPSYHLVLDSVSINQTTIQIISVPRVMRNGIDTNHGLPIINSWKSNVKSGTIEEYEIIKFVGEALGEKNMPEVKRKN